jgi:hypothetical protein
VLASRKIRDAKADDPKMIEYSFSEEVSIIHVLYMLPALVRGPGQQPSRQESSLIVGSGRGERTSRDPGPDCRRSSMVHNPSMVSLVVNAMIT